MPAKIMTQAMINGTFVICGECGSTIYTKDPESLVEVEADRVWLRCRNNCCGHVGRYSGSELIAAAAESTVDFTSRIFLEG